MDATSKNLVPFAPRTDAPHEQLTKKLIEIVVNSVHSKHSKRSYEKSLKEFLEWYAADGQELNKATVQRYAQRLAEQGLAAATQNVRLSAVRRLAAEAADNGLLAPQLATGISRVKGPKGGGTRTGNWLTVDQAVTLISAPDTTKLIGKRNRALLAVMIGSGLRREEVSEQITFERVQQRDGRWAIVDLIGKGGKLRTVPIPGWAKIAIDAWADAAGLSSGLVFRSMNNKGQVLGKPLRPQNIMEVVRKYGIRHLRQLKLAPHDLRRTFARLARKGKAPIEQIQLSLGHASIVTTEKYLGSEQDLQDAPCDHLGIRLPAA